MRFRVENLGPLREAEIDLGKRLIVLTGPNNTGKTYFATAVYGFFRAARSTVLASLPPVEGGRFSIRAEQLAELVQAELLRRRRFLEERLDKCFGAADGTFVDARVSADVPVDEVRKSLGTVVRNAAGWFWDFEGAWVRRITPERNVDFALVSSAFARSLPSHDPAWSDDEWASLPVLSELPEEESHRHVGIALHSLTLQLLGPQSSVFPAERLAMNLFAREIAVARTQLADVLIDSPELASSVQRLAWPVADAVVNAVRLPERAKRGTAFANLAESLESEILGGTISVSVHGAPTFAPRGVSKTLDVEQSASVVKSLSSLVFYFRHQAQKGDFLIIDEPELNLHPDNQRKVARFLARAVKRGFQIMISTHSDYVLRELCQLLQLGRDDERARKLAAELDYPADALLKPEDIGVYLFQNGTANEVEISEEGFEVKTIEDEIVRQNTIQQQIYSAFLD